MEQQNYRKARSDAGLKPEQAAAKLGVSVSTLFNWERGDTNPDANMVKKMAKLYKVSPDYLLGL
jgi:transcriptional regulator with XRE-family HTH domain